MKNLKYILPVFLLFVTKQLAAQDFPYHYFTHINPMLNNPAMAAVDYKMNAGVAAYSLTAGGFKPVNDYILSYSVSPDFKKRHRRNAYQTRIGLGGSFLHEQIGPFNQSILQLIYAYHIPLTKNTILSFGINGMVEHLEISVNSLNPLHDNDPRLLTGTNGSVILDGGFGASVKGNNYRISFSAMNLTPGVFSFKNGPAMDFENYRKYFISGSYSADLTEGFLVLPAITIRNSFNQNFCFDARMKFDLHFIKMGVGYRSEKSLFVFAQVPFNHFIFSYTSENPLLSNHMMGNGHTFSVSWNYNFTNDY